MNTIHDKPKALRVSTPPFGVVWYCGEVGTPDISGRLWKLLEAAKSPTTREIRTVLIEMRRRLKWSRMTLAAFLGVSEHTLRRWETGQRNPNGAARRLIWMADAMLAGREGIYTAMDVMLWNHPSRDLEESGRIAIPGLRRFTAA